MKITVYTLNHDHKHGTDTYVFADIAARDVKAHAIITDMWSHEDGEMPADPWEAYSQITNQTGYIEQWINTDEDTIDITAALRATGQYIEPYAEPAGTASKRETHAQGHWTRTRFYDAGGKEIGMHDDLQEAECTDEMDK